MERPDTRGAPIAGWEDETVTATLERAGGQVGDYLIPTALDMPPVVAELVEEPEPNALSA